MPQTRAGVLAGIASIMLVSTAFVSTSPDALSPDRELARALLEELVEIDTTDAFGNNTLAALAMQTRLLDAGFSEADVRVIGPHERKGNLVARLRGSGEAPPILLLAHLDVVDAEPNGWTHDPFELVEKDGFYYGRGTSDDKAMAAIWIANLILMKQEGFVPQRDLIVALTADEEGGSFNGVRFLLDHHRELVDASLCLNEGGGGLVVDGVRVANHVQLREKTYQSYRLVCSGEGGHSSIPLADNAIYRLSRALVRVSEHAFPIRLDDASRDYLGVMARFESGPLARDLRDASLGNDSAARARIARRPYYNAVLRTTCVATELEGGHAENALPRAARATVNCRLLPGTDTASVRATLEAVIDDEAVVVSPLHETATSPPSSPSPQVMNAIDRVTRQMWPGVLVVPTMSPGATDGLHLRNAGIPTYGVSGIFQDADGVRAHGSDERIGVEAFFEAREFLDRLTRELARPE